MLGPVIDFTDAASFLSQYYAIAQDGVYDFAASERPYVLDVGANIGLATIVIKQRHPSAKVVAIEADPDLAAIAKRNILIAGHQDVTVVSAAAWTHCGAIAFAAEGTDAGRVTPEGPITVPTVRLHDYLDRSVALLKMDIEGAEIDVLADCVDRLENVRAIAVEYHSFVDRPQRLAELLSILEAADMRVSVRHERAAARPLLGLDTHGGMDLQLNVWAWRS